MIIPIRIDKGPCGLSLCNKMGGCQNWCAREWPHTDHFCLDHIKDAVPDFNPKEFEQFGIKRGPRRC